MPRSRPTPGSRLAALLAAPALFAATLSPAWACDCAPLPSPQDALQQASEVFRGRVLEVADASPLRLVVFEVHETWKGPELPLATVATFRSGTLCGYPFVAGEEYLVYTDGPGFAHACTRTRALASAAGDLAALGAGTDAITAPLEVLVRHLQLAGSWYNPQRSGEGFQLEVLEDGRGVVYWFGYDATDPQRQSWLVGAGSFAGNVLEVDLVQPVGGGFGADFDPDAVERTPWGTLRLTLASDGTGEAEWSSSRPGFGAGSFAIQRLTRPPPF